MVSMTVREKAGAGTLYLRYKAGIALSKLWVTCLNCEFEIFTWGSERALPLSALDDAIRRHESEWHASSVE